MDLLCTFAVIESNPWYCYFEIERKSHSKISYFYGNDGILGCLVCWRNSSNDFFEKHNMCYFQNESKKNVSIICDEVNLYLSSGPNSFT